MGVLIIKCPVSGRYFSTGIETDADSFARMPNNVAAYAPCRHCRADHLWRPIDAKLVDAVPPNDWIENQNERKLTEVQMQIGKIVVLVEALNLLKASQLANTVMEMRKFCAEFKIPVPPLPDDLAVLAPCDFRLTETREDDGRRTGRIKFTEPDGRVLFEKEWLIAAPEQWLA